MKDDDENLIADLLEIMTEAKADFTNSFRALTNGTAVETQLADNQKFADWQTRWQQRLEEETADPALTMVAANPVRIPRNHRIEAVISAAVIGDYGPFETLHAALAQPYEDSAEFADFTAPPKPDEVVKATFCGT